MIKLSDRNKRKNFFSINYFYKINSTMDIARRLAKEGCADFTTVVAEIQTMGRGRMKRVWDSSCGGLYFTVVLRPDIASANASKPVFACSYILVKVLRDLFGINASVKWPNDILFQDKKLCGMLSEIQLESDKISFVNVGIGININNSIDNQPMAISLKKILGKTVSRKMILLNFLDRLKDFISRGQLKDVISLWKKYNVTLGRKVVIVTLTGKDQGIAEDIGSDGALILRQEDNSLKKIIHGDCFHIL